jgi:ATP-binding cassette subfamily B protein
LRRKVPKPLQGASTNTRSILPAKRFTLASFSLSIQVASADQIIVLDHGTIVERGRHEELRAKGGLYAELAAVQFGLHA